MAGVAFENLSKRFGETVAVDDLCWEVPDRALVVLVGPSGCGKTTTLRMIAGLEEPSSGTIRIGERVVNRLAPKDRNVAMVFQTFALYPHLTVFRNLSFGLEMRRLPRAEIEQRVRHACSLLSIDDLLERMPGELSGGQQQRVAIGRAIVAQPDVFLLDEPLSQLDARLRDTLRNELIRLHERLATTMLYVTHDQTEAMLMGQWIAVMHAGRIQQFGEPLEIYERPANRFVAEFIGTPPMNLVEGRLTTAGDACEFHCREWKLAVPRESRPRVMGRESITLGIRPHHLFLQPAPGASRVSAGSGIVRRIRPLGRETIVTVEVGSLELVLSVDANRKLVCGEQVPIDIDVNRSHWFDSLTGAAVPR